MRGVVIDAEWAPRFPDEMTQRQLDEHWAVYANLAYRNPSATLTELDDPTSPGPQEMVLKVGACGICGSDVHMFETDGEGYMLLPYHLKAPVVTGHEISGTVVAVGSEVAGFSEGDLVAVEEIQWCGRCTPCRGGYWNQCENVEDLGFTINGGFADYLKVDAKHCWSLNEVAERYGSAEIALEVGATCEPTSVAYEGMFTRAGGFKPGSAVAVFGLGPIGLAATALAAAAGASKVICFDTLSGRRQLAGDIGATHVYDPIPVKPAEVIGELTKGHGVAMAVEASGNFPAVIRPAEQSLAVGGKLAVIGMDGRPAELMFIDHQLKALSTYGSLGHCGSWDFPNVIGLMAAGRIDMHKAVTKRHPLDKLVDAIEETKQRADGKVLVKPSISHA
jgi:scyllo-inosose 3-dehydrogenase